MREFTASLVLLCTMVAGCQAPEKDQPAPIWLEVSADHYELSGTTYQSKAELVSALRIAKNPERITLHWVVYAKDSAEEATVLAKVEEAQSAAREAGLPPILGIGNKVFDK
jgi:hypothetical protein